MPILNLQRSYAQVGRIRLGEYEGGHPTKLGTFRLTSPDKSRIEAAAKLYGGTIAEWKAPAGLQYEVVTEAATIPVMLPPLADLVFSQWFELWSAAGCQRRCDGEHETISDQPCEAVCDPEARECKPHTRLTVLLPELPGLGMWRLDTQGWYAATELGHSVDNVIALSYRDDRLPVPAMLRLDQRVVKRGGKTMRFVVPVLDVTESVNELLAKQAVALQAARVEVFHEEPPAAVEPGDVKAPEPAKKKAGRRLTPVPDSGEAPPTIAEQTAAAEQIPSRRRANTPRVAPTKTPPRSAAQAAQASKGRTAFTPSAEPPGDDEPPPGDVSPAPEPPQDVVPETTSTPQDEPPAEPASPTAPITGSQLEVLSTLIKGVGLPDKPARRQFVVAMIGRDVPTVYDVYKQEAEMLIDKFDADPLLGERYKLDLQLIAAGFDDSVSQHGFITAAVGRDATRHELNGDEIKYVAEKLES